MSSSQAVRWKVALTRLDWRPGGPIGRLAVVLFAAIVLAASWAPFARNLSSVCAVGGAAAACTAVLPFVCPSGDCSWLAYQNQTPAVAEVTLRQASVSGLAAPAAAFHLGELLLDQGREAEGVSVWRTILYAEMRPAHEAAVAARAGQMAEAERLMAISMAVSPLPSYNLATSYGAMCEGWRTAGANQRALPWCRLALYAGGDNWAGLDAASASLAAGDSTGALALLGVVTGSSQGKSMAQAWRLTGAAHSAGSDPRTAVDDYRRALELGAMDQWTRMGLATALMRTGDPAGACEQVTAARSLGYVLNAGQTVEFKECVAGGRP